jgi:hypothetical protein
MVKKLNENNNYIYHIDSELRCLYNIEEHLRLWMNLDRANFFNYNYSTIYTINVDDGTDTITKIFHKSIDAHTYVSELVRKGLREFIIGNKELQLQSIEIVDSISDLPMVMSYLNTLSIDNFDVYTRLIYKGKILTSTPKIRHIISTIDCFEERYGCMPDEFFDDLPSADIGIEHEMNIIKEMFSKEELNEMLKK